MQSIGLIVPSGRENLKKTFAQPKSKFNEQFHIATRTGYPAIFNIQPKFNI